MERMSSSFDGYVVPNPKTMPDQADAIDFDQ
jgi:hypothetical protein